MASSATNVFDLNKHIEDVRTCILEGSGLKPEWIDFIKKDRELYSYLREAVKGLVKYYLDQEEGSLVIPDDKTKILAALKYSKPAEVKVIILGHDPVPNSDLATGLAFSFPDGVTSQSISLYGTSGESAVNVHEALKKAEITPGDSLNHEHWARRGVLLLNACLTLDPDNDDNIENTDKNPPKMEKPHFRYWERFTTRLVIKLLTKVKLPSPTFVLCWGTHAKNIGDLLSSKLPRGKYTFVNKYKGDHEELESLDPNDVSTPVVITIGHHPTFPRGTGNNFHTQATNQFKAIKRYPQYSALFDQITVEELEADIANSETKD